MQERQAGITLVELLIAAALAAVVVALILMVYLTQKRSQLRQEAVADIQLNLHYTVTEVKHHLIHSGLGLPDHIEDIEVQGDSLVLKINWSKKSSRMTSVAQEGAYVRLGLDLPGREIFRGKAFALVQGDSLEEHALRVGSDAASLLIQGDATDYSVGGLLYPLERVLLYLDADGGFHIGSAPGYLGNTQPPIALAEGIRRLDFQFEEASGAVSATPPDPLEDLRFISFSAEAGSALPSVGVTRSMNSRAAYRRGF